MMEGITSVIYKMNLIVIFSLLSFPIVLCTSSKERLSKTPPPQRNFILERYVGDWYVQGFSGVCSWPGAHKFTDFVSRYELRPGNRLTLVHTWRNVDCTTAVHQYPPQDVPGVFTLVDNIGDVITGESIVVATDYTSFAVKWGCVKRGLFKECENPYVVIKTRLRFPKRKTWQIVKNVLYDYFRFPMSEMTLYPQNNPCFGPDHLSPTGKYGRGGVEPRFSMPEKIIKEHHVML